MGGDAKSCAHLAKTQRKLGPTSDFKEIEGRKGRLWELLSQVFASVETNVLRNKTDIKAECSDCSLRVPHQRNTKEV